MSHKYLRKEKIISTVFTIFPFNDVCNHCTRLYARRAKFEEHLKKNCHKQPEIDILEESRSHDLHKKQTQSTCKVSRLCLSIEQAIPGNSKTPEKYFCLHSLHTFDRRHQSTTNK